MADIKDAEKGNGAIQQQTTSHSDDDTYGEIQTIDPNKVRDLSRSLQGRHMQMIAIGGSIGAGLFVGSGGALRTGGPASLLLGFMVIGAMMLFTVLALGEMAILYPVNGAFYEYAVRFIDPSWGYAMGWQYSVGWLITLPYEIIAASVTISFWNDTISPGVWVAVFLAALIIIQIFGVRGYGEVEFTLAIIKITACVGFIILGIIIDCGGVPTDNRGYIGAHYWHDPGAFRNGFKGFCSVFVTAAFSFGGTELVGLAAAEAANPAKSLPKATKQVFWRIFLFYILNVFIVGLIVPSDSDVLIGSSGANTKASPFVLAVEMAGIKVLPHIINGVITISVLSVANSCTYGSTRVLQALAMNGKAPKIFARIDNQGRPIWCIVLQVLVGFLAFVTLAAQGSTALSWLMAITGLSGLFAYGSIMLSHIRFRQAWKKQGRDEKDIPWKATFGVWGSYFGLLLVFLALAGTFYSALFPPGSSPNAQAFFESYLAAPITIALFLFFKVWDKDWKLGVNLMEIDLDKGRRPAEEIYIHPEEHVDLPIWKKVLNFLF